MAPFGLMSVGNVLVKTLGLFSSAATVRCSCIVPALKHFSTSVRGPPKRPLTAYMHYVKEQQPVVVRQNPDTKRVDIIRKIAQQWRTLTLEQKRPFEELYLAAKEQYKVDKQKYQAELTPAQTAAMAEERRQKMAKRKANRKKRELTSLGKPKGPRTAFNIFMAEHFEEAKGSTMQGRLKSLVDDWSSLNASQKQVYVQLAEDDKVRYKNEMKTWEDHMAELGREDLVRRKEMKTRKKPAVKKASNKKPQVKKLKAKKSASSPAQPVVKKTERKTKN